MKSGKSAETLINGTLANVLEMRSMVQNSRPALKVAWRALTMLCERLKKRPRAAASQVRF